MGVTRFPNGVEVGDGTTAGTFTVGGTAITPLNAVSAGQRFEAGTVTVPAGASGTAITTNLTTITYVGASPYSTVASVAGYAGVVASHSGGTVTLIGVSGAGTVSTANGTATWWALGT